MAAGLLLQHPAPLGAFERINMTNNRILYISQEISPYLPSTPIADFGRQLPQTMQQSGKEVRIFMPNYGSVNERRNQLHEVIRLSGLGIIISDNDHPLIIKVASLQPARIQVYFIDNDDYFQKLASDVDPVGSNRTDNDERAIFYARGTMETVKKLRWDPKTIHVSGWISALLPLYIRKLYGDEPAFKNSKIVYSVLPDSLNAPLDEGIFAKLKEEGVGPREIKKFADLPLDTNLLHRMAIEYSDGVAFHTPEADPALLEFAKASGKKILMPEKVAEGVPAFSEFYDSL